MNRFHLKNTASRCIAIVILLASLIITQTACSKETQAISEENYYLDTICTISIYDMEGGLNEEDAKAVLSLAWDRCRELEKHLSKTIQSSDIYKLNTASGAWVEVSDDTLAVIKSGLKYSELSDGDFDITIGGVTALWDFQSEEAKLPDQADLDEALLHVDYRNVQIDGNNVRLADPETQLDLGGIGKGYVADELTELLQNEGVSSAIINLGGNVVTLGNKPDADGFNIGIEKPYSDRKELIGSVNSANQTIITSGVYERQFELDGKVYHHVLSPKNGYPVETDLDAVSLVADIGHSADTDALSTICLLKGSRAGKVFIEKQGIPALFCLSDGSIIKSGKIDFKEK